MTIQTTAAGSVKSGAARSTITLASFYAGAGEDRFGFELPAPRRAILAAHARIASARR